MTWLLTILPTLAGLVVWLQWSRTRAASRRLVAGATAVLGLIATALVALAAGISGTVGTYDVGGGLSLSVAMVRPANVVAVLVPLIAAAVVAYAAAHEPEEGLGRLLGLLTVFVGAMELLVTAADLLTLTVAFELVGGLSWALIGHDWRDGGAPKSAAHAYNATRLGGLGLFLAAGAAFAGTGSMAFRDLGALSGPELHVVAAGVLLAAVAKSAQGPFAPWLFSAMAGPTPVSALLHSSTMVAAGAYALIRLHPVLDLAGWFGPVSVAVGLGTALTGGVVALLQPHAKKLLAASTSAQYGLMLVAIGAGYPAVAAIHLVVHAVFKALLFLAAGVGIQAAGSPLLGSMRLGRQLPRVAALAACGALALAAIPPLGGGWSKEAVVAAAGHRAPSLAVLVILAGALSAAYAARFQLLAFGRGPAADPSPRSLATRPTTVEVTAMGVLAAATIALGALWLPAVHQPAARLLGGQVAEGMAWEFVTSMVVIALAGYGVLIAERSGRLGHLGTTGFGAAAADWLGLPDLTRRALVDPTLAMSAALARLDDQVVDRIVNQVAATAGRAAQGMARWVDPRIDGAVHGVAGAAGRTGRLVAEAVDPRVDALIVGRTVGVSRAVVRGSQHVIEGGIDGAVAGVAALVDRAGADARRTHTGMVHHQFVAITIGVAAAILAAVAGR